MIEIINIQKITLSHAKRNLEDTTHRTEKQQTDSFLACTKSYYFDVADDSRVCYVEKDFSSKVICKKPHDEVQCLHYDVSKYSKSNLLGELF